VHTLGEPKGKEATMVAADEFPDVLIAKHISKHLHLSVEQVYNLFRLSPAKGAYRVSQSADQNGPCGMII